MATDIETEGEVEVTEDELVAAVLAAFMPTEDSAGVTTAELVDATGKSNKWILSQLRQLRKSGRLDVVRRTSETIDGRLTKVPAYILKNESKADSSAC